MRDFACDGTTARKKYVATSHCTCSLLPSLFHWLNQIDSHRFGTFHNNPGSSVYQCLTDSSWFWKMSCQEPWMSCQNFQESGCFHIRFLVFCQDLHGNLNWISWAAAWAVIYTLFGCSKLGMKQLLTTHLYYGDYVKLLQGSLCRPIWGGALLQIYSQYEGFPLK